MSAQRAAITHLETSASSSTRAHESRSIFNYCVQQILIALLTFRVTDDVGIEFG